MTDCRAARPLRSVSMCQRIRVRSSSTHVGVGGSEAPHVSQQMFLGMVGEIVTFTNSQGRIDRHIGFGPQGGRSTGCEVPGHR